MQNEPFVFLPGFLCDERLWKNQIAAFSDHVVNVVDFKSSHDLDAMIAEVGKTPHAKFHLIGFSMGGFVAEAFAVKYPERVISLTLIAANVGKLPDAFEKGRKFMTELLEHARYKGMNEKELPFYLHPDSLKNSLITQTIIEMSRGFTAKIYVDHTKATFERDDLSELIDKQNYPVLIVGSTYDKVVPADVLKNIHTKIKRSSLEFVDHSGHYIPLEEPEKLNALIKTITNKK